MSDQIIKKKKKKKKKKIAWNSSFRKSSSMQTNFCKCDRAIFREPYSGVFKPYSDILKPYSSVLELDFPKIEFHAFFFFLVLLGITRFSTNQVFH